MGYRAEMIADSLSPDGIRLVTMELEYPRFIHPEVLRTRMWSHAVMSSRAVPPEEMIRRAMEDPFVPATFNRRVKGMGVGVELSEQATVTSKKAWLYARDAAVNAARIMLEQDVDKSRINRVLEPYLWLHDIVTFTEYENTLALRCPPGDQATIDFPAQLEYQELALLVRGSLQTSVPQQVDQGWWHLPKITGEELADLCTLRDNPDAPVPVSLAIEEYKRVSVRRVARVSFDKHTDTEPWEESITKANTLQQSAHFSPFEMVARPFMLGEWDSVHAAQAELQAGVEIGELPAETAREFARSLEFCGNLRGWVPFRKEIENEDNFMRATELRPDIIQCRPKVKDNPHLEEHLRESLTVPPGLKNHGSVEGGTL